MIGIYHNAGVNIEGKLLKIMTSSGNGEYIRVMSAEDGDRSEYLLTEKLTEAYPKIGTMIMPVSECLADRGGDFLLLLKSGPSSAEMICEAEGANGIVQKKTDISGSNYVKVDLIG